MKRLFFILMILCFSIFCAYADSTYDKETNYQFKNMHSLKGETLFLVPLTGANYTTLMGKPVEHYHNFKDYNNFWKDDMSLCYTANNYKFDPYNPIDNMVAGTHKRWIEKHVFYVDDVKYIENDYWVLYLTDLNTNEKVKYISNGGKKSTKIDMENFPFIVEKHFNYLMSLIGTNLIFSIKEYGMFFEEPYAPFYYNTYETDIDTEEKINYNLNRPYAKWKIKDVGYDIYNMKLYFLVTDGHHTTKVFYDNQYSEQHPTFNIGNRVFTESQWNNLVNKYGERHMSLIMSTILADDMTLEEKYLAGGIKFAKTRKPSNTPKEIKEIKDATVNATKRIINDFDKEDVMTLIKIMCW